MEPEFSRLAVATLIAAIIGSILDPNSEDAPPERRRSPRQPSDAPDAQAFAALAHLVRHFDFRARNFVGTQVPERVFDDLVEIRRMLGWTIEHQGQFGPTSDRPN